MNPSYRPPLKVIRLNLFFFCDMITSSSDGITRAMRGQPKRLSRNYLRRNGGKCGEKSFYMFRFSKDVSRHRCFLHS